MENKNNVSGVIAYDCEVQMMRRRVDCKSRTESLLLLGQRTQLCVYAHGLLQGVAGGRFRSFQ